LVVHIGMRRSRGGELDGFSRNAKLLLIQSPFGGLTVSLIQLLFNLYLLALGFDLIFVAKFVAIQWTLHGLSVIPFGILSDLFGRRRVYLWAYSGNILSTAVVLFTPDPSWLLLLAGITGFFQGGHAIIGPPFMREQSRPHERVHLFSLTGGIRVGAAGFGNLAAGALPFLYAGLFGIGPESAWALRASLLTALPLMACSMIPYYLINEQWRPMDIRRWVKGIESIGPISMLSFTELMVGIAMGFTTPFLNIYFLQHIHASTDQIGLVFAAASVLTAVVTIFVPFLVNRLGRVRTVTYVKLLGIPSLILLGMTDSMFWAAIFYSFTILMIGGPFPNRGIADPIFSLIAMDVVKERERGTTNGIMHASVEIPRGFGASLAGPFMAAGSWQVPFAIGGLVFAAAFIVYYLYFVRLDGRQATVEGVAAAAID
ncbi:MAG TPA: MFS transporter, partial [Candidatus Binatia bacterium]